MWGRSRILRLYCGMYGRRYGGGGRLSSAVDMVDGYNVAVATTALGCRELSVDAFSTSFRAGSTGGLDFITFHVPLSTYCTVVVWDVRGGLE